MEIEIDFKNKKRKYELKMEYCSDYNYYKFSCVNSKNEELGFATFLINRKSYFSKIWLIKIETNNQYQHEGVGTALISALEYFAYKHNISYIEGKYYPGNQFALPFYTKNGYTIDREDYNWYVSKNLNFNETKQLENSIKNYIEPNDTKQDMCL